jgi:hypothetical protein
VFRRHAVGRVLAVVLVVTGGAVASGATVAYAAPAGYPPVTALQERYAATQEAVSDALAVAREAGDAGRAEALARLAGRQLLGFDPRGNGRVVEVIGDLATADRIVVLVPGSNSTLDTFDRLRQPGGAARAVAREVAALHPRSEAATIAWLGYQPPHGFAVDAAIDRVAREGAEALRTTLAELRIVNPAAPISLLCHSYGSVVCAIAAPEAAPISEIALYGSPGVGIGSAARLGTSARIWAGRAANDWIRFVPSVRLAGIGFGTDPTAAEFGARIFDAGGGGHGDYHLPGSTSLRSLALIALGETPDA